MRDLWERHDRLARDLVRQRGGLEIGCNASYLLLFESTREALSFAADYHAALAGLHPALQAGIGLHAGPVRLRTNSAADTGLGATRCDLDGAALPLVARVMAAALAGQTLLTPAVLQALGPDAGALTCVDEPVELFEAHHATAPACTTAAPARPRNWGLRTTGDRRCCRTGSASSSRCASGRRSASARPGPWSCRPA